MLRINNKDTRTTLTLHFTSYSSVSIVNFEQVNANVYALCEKLPNTDQKKTSYLDISCSDGAVYNF